MPVTNYYTVNGEIIGERTAGSPRVDYLTDALGSVTATVNQSAQVVNTYRYKPHGALLAKTGTGPDPAFGWVGTQGYRPTKQNLSDFYVRARHYDEVNGRWPNVDPIGFGGGDINFYAYIGNNPASWLDLSGLAACGGQDSGGGSNGIDPTLRLRVIPDPQSPVSPLPGGGSRYCFIVVDQVGKSYTNPNARVVECIRRKQHGKPKTGPNGNCNWVDMTGANDGHATLPRFCDPMAGATKTKGKDTKGNETNYQCYAVEMPIQPGQTKPVRIVLEPCPFEVEYGGDGRPHRTSGTKGHKVDWG